MQLPGMKHSCDAIAAHTTDKSIINENDENQTIDDAGVDTCMHRQKFR